VDIPLVGRILRGLIIEMLGNGLELIDSCYLRSGRNIFHCFSETPS
jgi:hypothetical protein